MNKTGAKLAGSTHPGRYTPWNEPLSRPILRTYSAEVTSPGEQSPASSQCAPFKALDYCTTLPHRKSRSFLPVFQSFFTVLALFTESCMCNMPNASRQPPRRRRGALANRSCQFSSVVPVRSCLLSCPDWTRFPAASLRLGPAFGPLRGPAPVLAPVRPLGASILALSFFPQTPPRRTGSGR